MRCSARELPSGGASPAATRLTAPMRPAAVAARPYTAGLVSQRPALGCLFEIVETLVLTLVIFFVIQNFVAQPYKVQQKSMQRTLEEDQYVLVDKLTPRFDAYDRGDIVVFEPPEEWGEATRRSSSASSASPAIPSRSGRRPRLHQRRGRSTSRTCTATRPAENRNRRRARAIDLDRPQTVSCS